MDTPTSKNQNVVQPDILIVCDKTKIQDRGCYGLPDWICEIISPGSIKLDTIIKLSLYEEAGVPEYWIVYPDGGISVYRLVEGKYGMPDVVEYDRGEPIPIASVPGVALEYAGMFG